MHALARRGADLIQQYVNDVLPLGRGVIAERPLADAVGQRLRQLGQAQYAGVGGQGGAGRCEVRVVNRPRSTQISCAR